MKRQNLLLLAGIVLLTVLPLLLIKPTTAKEELFTGADGQAEAAITAIRPEYKPWFAPLWEPPSDEIESLLFGLQAALGAGVIGYCLGLHRGRKLARHGHAAPR